MITSDNIDECVTVIQALTMAMGGVLNAALGVPAASLKYGLSDLLSNAEESIRDATVIQDVCDVFALAYNAGASISSIETVRATLTGLSPVSDAATLITAAGIQCCLGVEVEIYSATIFTSRQDVDAALVQINTAFEAAEEFAADSHLSDAYQSLIRAHAAIVAHLSSTGRPLPKMTTYSVGNVITSHALAQRLYCDPSRADELMLENKVISPLFMQATGIALSA